jgi:hypothetical protein
MARFVGPSAAGGNANTGDITFDGVQIIGAGNASGDGLGAGTIELVPDATLNSDQYLIIDPTAPGHIHIRAGGTQDASTADLIIGGEETNLLVSDNGDYVDIRTTSETATNIWRFGSDGILSGPGMSTLYTYWITAPESSLKLSSSSDQVILDGATGEFLRDETNPNNQIATIGDIGVDTSFTVAGGTLGTAPTFDGAPLFTGSYVKTGSMIHFRIDVDFDNITSFGTGQYYLDLPFPAKYNYEFVAGCLHDISETRDYPMTGHVYAGESRMLLKSLDSQGNSAFAVPFTATAPITLTTADNFHIAGNYIWEPEES